jgi:hypothetical protein
LACSFFRLDRRFEKLLHFHVKSTRYQAPAAETGAEPALENLMRRRTNVSMTKIVLAISFIILLGRMIYAGIGAISHHQEKQLIQPDRAAVQTIPARAPSAAPH